MNLKDLSTLPPTHKAPTRFDPALAPTSNRILSRQLDVIAHTIARRIARFLEKAGYLVRDA